MITETKLVSIMAVNNETGVINDIENIARFCQANRIFFHVDAVQAIGKIAVDVNQWPVTLLSMSAHKCYGPKGIGVLYVRRRSELTLQPQIHGGNHERGMRSGTLASHQIVGMGKAAAIIAEEREAEVDRLSALKLKLWAGLSALGNISMNGDVNHCSPTLLNVCFHGIDGEALMMAVRDLAISSGSACTSATVEPSFVLKAMGLSDADAHSSLRISLGRYTSEEEIDIAISRFTDAILNLRDNTVSAEG